MFVLVSIHRPNDFDHANQLNAAVHQAIDEVNDAMVSAGVRRFVGGLQSPKHAISLHRSEEGTLAEAAGGYLEAANYVDGFWVLECETMEEAVEWGRRAAQACRGSVEVRPFAGALLG